MAVRTTEPKVYVPSLFSSPVAAPAGAGVVSAAAVVLHT